MQRWKFLFACLFIPIAYVVAGVLTIIADKPLHEDGHNCPPDSPGKAYKLGTASLCLMGAALAITNGMFKCPRIRSKSDSARPSTSMKVAWITFLLFWGITLTAAILIGAAISTDYPKSKICSVTDLHLPSIGGALCFTDAVVSTIYVISSSMLNTEE
ncbi:uncharacterized protein LOC120266816 isoform X2 [Dioscorea cayenensis subsp. rotundata]|uniref:Uncharacterized protein LOC120266816 isoform X2 n=1 Tax=Dioscorea cayennensis subsp. rotundata TaxID=55577 RepID=A0AB40BTV2_DIOCR|nr:uncharacterized protein LOC120266816 isoform X2 [Dioscorea cayenensis subsp. rotundata]